MAVEQEVESTSTIPRSAPSERLCIGALVMHADYRGLAIVHGLVRYGIPVWVLQHEDQLLATLSRYNRRTLSWAIQDEEENVKLLVQFAERENVRDWVLFPTGNEGAALAAPDGG